MSFKPRLTPIAPGFTWGPLPASRLNAEPTGKIYTVPTWAASPEHE